MPRCTAGSYLAFGLVLLFGGCGAPAAVPIQASSPTARSENSAPSPAVRAGATPPAPESKTCCPFDKALQFLQQHTDAFALKSADGRALVAVVPQYQGRVMTSSLGGGEGASLGWINEGLIASGKTVPQMNAFGGEDRFWLGPEGGQFGLFFKPSMSFDFANWATPAGIDAEPFTLESKRDDQATFVRDLDLTNHSGTRFQVGVKRTVRMLTRASIKSAIGWNIPEAVALVAFESENTITNKGARKWEKKTGLPSIWILGMFNPTPTTTVVAPFVSGDEAKLGPVVNDAYFGKVPAERLKVGEGAVFFKGDGRYRSKIGLSRKRAKPVLGSYDPSQRLLTLVHFTLPEGATDYVNSMWEKQARPYGGDVANSYNDGPNPSGDMLGPFYELESSSPAAALAPGKSLTHVHRTLHLQGTEAELDAIAYAVLGVHLDQIPPGGNL